MLGQQGRVSGDDWCVIYFPRLVKVEDWACWASDSDHEPLGLRQVVMLSCSLVILSDAHSILETHREVVSGFILSEGGAGKEKGIATTVDQKSVRTTQY